MISLTWPWVLVFCALPLFTLVILKPKVTPSASLIVPRIDRFRMAASRYTASIQGKWIWRSLLITLMWSFLMLALAQPRLTGDPVEIPSSGRDLFLAVDVSGSMNREDMLDLNSQRRYVTRLDAVKSVVTSFLENRTGDRVGLILFGTNPYVYAPLTHDLETVDQLLQEAPNGIAGTQTSIGDTVGLAVKRLRERPADHRTLILLTDGDQTVGTLSLRDAGSLAAANDVRIYTIAFGGMGDRGGLFQSIVPQRLDFRPLQELAEATGGQHFSATSTTALKEVYETIDQLEVIDQDPETFRPVKELFYWPLSAALAFFLLLWFTGNRWNG